MQEEFLSGGDLRGVYRLILELCEIGDNAHAWRKRFHQGLIDMVRASVVWGYVIRGSRAAGARAELLIETGTEDLLRRYFAKGVLNHNPAIPAIVTGPGTDFTGGREEFVDNKTWHASAFHREVCAPANVDHVIHSQVCIDPPGVVDCIGIARPVGASPFARRDVELVRLAHQEIARLWRKPDALGVHSLPNRLRQTLYCIRGGLARKEIASRLRISVNTVHLYEKTLFKRYGVCGRSELVSRLAGSIHPVLLPLEQCPAVIRQTEKLPL